MSIRIATSLSPNRMERQKLCIESWRRRGAEIIAVQPRGDLALQPEFPDIQFIETDLVAEAFGKPQCVRIAAITALADRQPLVILNSDIELKMSRSDFEETWGRRETGVLQVGIRWDRHPRFRQARIFKWGLDAFLITPQIAADLPDIGLALGCPGWDYWIPWHLNSLGYQMRVISTYEMEHVLHKQIWLKSESQIFYNIMMEKYGVSERGVINFIQKSTGREGVRAWKPNL